jgi:DNA adenine methylase
MSRKPKIHAPLPFTFGQVLETIAHEQDPVTGTLAGKPFLKWVGGKRSILPLLVERMPKEYTSYHEVFVGGGALFFDRQPKNAFLSDINFHLIITYQAVRDDVERLIELLRSHSGVHKKEYYLAMRLGLHTETDPTKIAALFIYLNKTCYNGLYRVNKAGGFNVPMGDYKDPTILDETTLRNDSKLLQGVTITQHSFTQIKPKKGAFYYLDPPYHKTYNGYDGGGFGDEEHIKLAELCHKIHRAGGYFMLSNSDTDFVKNLYKAYTIEDVMASRSVSCKSNQRGKENELIIRNYQ